MSDLPNVFSKLQKRTHAQYAILGAAIIEERLLKVLLTKMGRLSGKMKKQLFDGYGPLSTFSAKIDLSYALQLITKDDYDDLTVIRKIRNEFAHSIEFVDFDTQEIRTHFEHFTEFGGGEIDRRDDYLRRLKELETRFNDIINAGNQSSAAEHFPT